MLVGAAFPRMIGSSEVTARPGRGFQSSVAVELGPVVAGEGMHRMRLLRYLSAAVIWVYIGSFPLLAENGSLLAPQVTVFISASVALGV